MFTLPFLLAAGSLPLISGAPIASSLYTKSARAESSPSLNERSTSLIGIYAAVFGGDGLVSDGWPSISEWFSSFDELFEANEDLMSSSCAQWDVANNSDEENANLKKAINEVAESSGVDARYILSIVMQESVGCVRVQTTDNGVNNPGLMQSHNGKGSCNIDGTVQNPCPYSEIKQMIVDGVEGTTDGDGLKQLIAQEGGSDDATSYYKAARCYNSGSIASDGNLGQGIATHCYVSDVANRLLGWTSGTSSCETNTVGDLESSNWTGSSSSGSGSSSASSSTSTSTSSATPESTPVSSTVPEPTITSSAVPEPTTTSSSVPTQTPEPSPAQPTTTSSPVVPTPAASSTTIPSATPSASASSVPTYPYATSSCSEYYSVVDGDYCEKVESLYGITASQFRGWNSGLDEKCSNLWKGYKYCVKA
ncbi:hypothetical protein N7478_006836 [Penicillium angulare]|uniref:uncharacterized protein n=1 Tax=Penicillium angulare TaxID=116970 RepID=UPI00253FEF66|nr:uncharacterized protein N7478_006836 [Penicillium angulare]KAJ5281464.1 hypothetical protein N7478_006836 [Penicillium angulare]